MGVPVVPPGVTLDVLISQVLIRWNLSNIGVPVVPPGVTLVFPICGNFSTYNSKNILRASKDSHLLKPCYTCKLTRILLASSPPRRDSRSSDFTSSNGREFRKRPLTVSPPRRSS